MYSASTVYVRKQFKTFLKKITLVDFDVRATGLKLKCLDKFITSMQLFTSQDVKLMDSSQCGLIVMFLSAVWTLILMAPIHCRGSIGEQVM